MSDDDAHAIALAFAKNAIDTALNDEFGTSAAASDLSVLAAADCVRSIAEILLSRAELIFSFILSRGEMSRVRMLEIILQIQSQLSASLGSGMIENKQGGCHRGVKVHAERLNQTSQSNISQSVEVGTPPLSRTRNVLSGVEIVSSWRIAR